MITLENKTFKMLNGQVMKDIDNKEINTLLMLEAVLMGSAYESSSQVLMAGKILNKIKDREGKIELEDSDFSFIKQWVSKFPPIVSKGTLFLEFLQQFEDKI